MYNCTHEQKVIFQLEGILWAILRGTLWRDSTSTSVVRYSPETLCLQHQDHHNHHHCHHHCIEGSPGSSSNTYIQFVITISRHRHHSQRNLHRDHLSGSQAQERQEEEKLVAEPPIGRQGWANTAKIILIMVITVMIMTMMISGWSKNQWQWQDYDCYGDDNDDDDDDFGMAERPIIMIIRSWSCSSWTTCWRWW